MDEFGAPATGDNLLGFTGGASPMDSNDADPMSFMGGGGGGEGMGSASPGHVDPFAGVPVKDSMDGGGYNSGIPEMSALREWEDKHESELEEKSRAEQGEKSKARDAAAAELAKWNEERVGNIAKKHATNRADEETFAAAQKSSPQGATPWERIVDLIDTSARSADDCRDVSRMRALLIQLKATPPAKAA